MYPKLENLQFLGVFGILQETLKLIYQWRKIFTQITLSFILPFCLLTLANMAISISFLTKPQPSNNNAISSQIISHLISNILFPIFTTIFSLISTATVIYTVACIYTGRDVSFKHVLTILPKVWRRVLVTFLCVFVALLALNFVSIFVIIIILVIIFSISGPNGFSFVNYSLIIPFMILVVLVVVGSSYLSLIWQLSSEVSVLEELCGFKAMAKSKALAKGKMSMITRLYMLLGLPFGVIQLVFYHLAIQPPSVGVVLLKCILGITWVFLFSFLLLVALVARTHLYFVCKSYHHENVDELALSDHLQCYLKADYVPLKADDHIEVLQIV